MSAIPMREVPLAEKQVLSYRELQALGICAERTLRRLVTAGKVTRAIVRNGARVKFEKAVLLEELREGATTTSTIGTGSRD